MVRALLVVAVLALVAGCAVSKKPTAELAKGAFDKAYQKGAVDQEK